MGEPQRSRTVEHAIDQEREVAPVLLRGDVLNASQLSREAVGQLMEFKVDPLPASPSMGRSCWHRGIVIIVLILFHCFLVFGVDCL